MNSRQRHNLFINNLAKLRQRAESGKGDTRVLADALLKLATPKLLASSLINAWRTIGKYNRRIIALQRHAAGLKQTDD